MNRYLMVFVFCFVGLAMVADVEACQRCGLFGNRCKFASHVAVAPVAIVRQPEVFVVQNNYPPANGAAALLAQQGGTVYGLQAAAHAYTLDPAAVLRQAADLARGAQQLAADGLNGYNTSASLAMQLNQQANDSLAKGTAAALVLNAAGLNQQALNASPQALRLIRGPDGRWNVEQADPATVAEKLTNKAQASTAPNEQMATGGSVVSAKCGQCHGLAKAEPAAGLYLDDGHAISCEQALRSVRAVMSGKMPKGQKLTPQELTALVDELTRLGSQE